jgi:hypothetical protein
MAIGVNENVFELNIPVYYSVLVKIAHALKYLTEKDASLGFAESAFLSEILVQLVIRTI